MSKKAFKNAALYYLLRLTRHLSLRGCQRLGTCVGWILWCRAGRMRSTTQINLDLCVPQLPQSERDFLARRSLIETGKSLIEMPKIWSVPFSQCAPWIRSTHGEGDLKNALQAPQGLLLILPHLGNWEIVNHYLAPLTSVTALYKPAKQPVLERIISQARNHANTQMVPTNARGVKAVLTTLKKGGVSVILADQEPARPGGVFADFFGQPAYTATLAAKLITQTQCQTLCIFAKRLPKAKGFEVCLSPLDQDALASQDVVTRVTAINRAIETCIRQCFTQYQWDYKRFKQTPQAPESHRKQVSVYDESQHRKRPGAG